MGVLSDERTSPRPQDPRNFPSMQLFSDERDESGGDRDKPAEGHGSQEDGGRQRCEKETVFGSRL